MQRILQRLHATFANNVESLRRPLPIADPQIHEVILA